MDIAPINEQLNAHEPEQMGLRRISEYGNTLTLVFLCHGGPMEHLEFVVTFENAAVFHLPSDPSQHSCKVQAFFARTNQGTHPRGELRRVRTHSPRLGMSSSS